MKKLPLKEKVYTILRHKIISCEYPPNSFLTEEDLLNVTGTSRTPIREALQKLEEDRLIRIFPKRGIYILPIDSRSIEDIFEIRMLLEPYLVRTYAARIPDDVLQQELESIRTSNAPFDPKNDASKGFPLHKVLLQATENQHLISVLRSTFFHSYRLRVFSGISAEENLQYSQQEHLLILQKLLEHDYEAAAQSMTEHLVLSRQRCRDALSGAGSYTYPRSGDYNTF